MVTKGFAPGDLVRSENGRNYVVYEVFRPEEVRDGHTLYLKELLSTGSLHPFGRWKPADVTLICAGKYAEHVRVRNAHEKAARR